MPRKKCCRRVSASLEVHWFKPVGIPMRELDEVILAYDELEAIRLADMLKLYHADGAKRMGISRPTFGRIVSEARSKVADALLHGKAIRIESGIEYISLIKKTTENEKDSHSN
jgi:uncharacterized protein